MKAFLKNHRGLLIAAGIFLLFLCGWVLLWSRISQNVNNAEQEDAFSQFVYSGAYYTRCDAEAVRAYVPGTGAIDESLCGTQLGDMSIPTPNGPVICPLFACKALEDAELENSLLFLKRDSSILPYELSGFQVLDSDPSIWAVCAAYGIGGGKDFAAVTVRDTDGTELMQISDPDALDEFFRKFAALGEDLTDDEAAECYRDAYIAEFGDDGRITIADGKASAADDETYDKAMELWSRGVCAVDIRLTNGLQLRGCLYAPEPGLFTVYGVYHFDEPFF